MTAFSGEGALTLESGVAIATAVSLSGGSTLTLGSLQAHAGTAAFGGEGTFSGDAELSPTYYMQVSILDRVNVSGYMRPGITRAPGDLNISIVAGLAHDTVTVEINTGLVATAMLDSDGGLDVTIPVPNGLLAGIHALSVTSSSANVVGASAQFWLLKNPDTLPVPPGDGEDPVFVPEAASSTGVHRWVLQDLYPVDGLGSFVFPRNPVSSSAFPHASRDLAEVHTLSQTGAFSFTEGPPVSYEWSCQGVYDSQTFCDQLLAYAQLKRRLYLIDHRNRAWTVAITGVELVPRRRVRGDDGQFNDWVGEYVLNALIYGNDWKEPVA